MSVPHPFAGDRSPRDTNDRLNDAFAQSWKGGSDPTEPTLTSEVIRNWTIGALANAIRKDWKKINFAAKPYLDSMSQMDFVDPKGHRDMADDAAGVVIYFISNAATWKGEVAKLIKAELKRRVK